MLIFLSFNVETSQRTDRRSSVIVIAVIVVVVAVVVVVVAIISLFCTDIVRVSRVSNKIQTTTSNQKYIREKDMPQVW